MQLMWVLVSATLIFLGSQHILMFWMQQGGLMKQSILAKCAGSFACAVLAAAGVASLGGTVVASLLFWCLVFCMLGDYLIEQNMVAGGVAFAVGHGLLIVWTLGRTGFHWQSIPVWLVTFLLVLASFRRESKQMGGMIPAFTLYAAVLTADFALAAVLPFLLGMQWLPLAVGLLCFVMSDVILGKNQFGETTTVGKQKGLMVLYYLALFFIALTAWTAV